MLITTKELDVVKLQDDEEKEEEGLGLDEVPELGEEEPEGDSKEEFGGFGEEEKI